MFALTALLAAVLLLAGMCPPETGPVEDPCILL